MWLRVRTLCCLIQALFAWFCYLWLLCWPDGPVSCCVVCRPVCSAFVSLSLLAIFLLELNVGDSFAAARDDTTIRPCRAFWEINTPMHLDSDCGDNSLLFRFSRSLWLCFMRFIGGKLQSWSANAWWPSQLRYFRWAMRRCCTFHRFS